MTVSISFWLWPIISIGTEKEYFRSQPSILMGDFQTRVILLPRDVWQGLDTFLVAKRVKRCCLPLYSQLVVEASIVTEHPTMHRAPHTTKNYPAQNVNSAKGENPDLNSCYSECCLLPGSFGLL